MVPDIPFDTTDALLSSLTSKSWSYQCNEPFFAFLAIDRKKFEIVAYHNDRDDNFVICDTEVAHTLLSLFCEPTSGSQQALWGLPIPDLGNVKIQLCVSVKEHKWWWRADKSRKTTSLYHKNVLLAEYNKKMLRIMKSDHSDLIYDKCLSLVEEKEKVRTGKQTSQRCSSHSSFDVKVHRDNKWVEYKGK
jgi:hypothetical protein